MDATNQFISGLAEKISMPDIYLKIRKLMEKPNAKVADYERLLETDSMLSIRIIRIANSDYFGFNRKADDLYDAISIIGVIQLHDLLLASLCMRTFWNIPDQILNYHDFWWHGITCGIAARSIGKIRGLPASNRLFTLGLLLEIGHALMFIKAPELAIKSLMESRQHRRSIDAVEREYFGFDYCQLGSALMRQWQLPDVYSQMVLYHLNPSQADAHYSTEAEIVNIAHHFCEDTDLMAQKVDIALIQNNQLAGLSEDSNAMISQEIIDHVDEIFTMLSPPVYRRSRNEKRAVRQ
jgi:HD-like signal output (HDOD) protein